MVKKRMIVEGLRGFGKPATLRYPAKPSIPPKGYRGKPEFDAQKCIGCGACAQACPAKAIELRDDGDERKLILSYVHCSFCGRCQDVCPEDAIHLTNEYELATFVKEKAFTEVRLRLLKCSNCGRPFIPFSQADAIARRVKDTIEKYGIKIDEVKALYSVCPNCRVIPDEMAKRKLFLLRLKK
ncbi:4Fe-4S dicluster domain-containing protein [Candidatus Bathyarchaeota archaeon]|nr:4Fe-4S dicluster domain-containing protein [Candidatus Bathyarchaeota archaeon]